MYTITLADGTSLENLELNGNNYIAPTLVDNAVFAGNLGTVTISDGETTRTYRNMTLVQNTTYGDGRSWFILEEGPPMSKPDELYAACEADFSLNGFSVQTSKGRKTFTLDLYDQSNLQFIGNKIALSTASKFPYHAKDEHKEIWSAEDMLAVITAGEVHKTIRLVYLDMLFQWLERAAPEELDSIAYIPCEQNEEVGQNLPPDLLAKMWALLAETQA